VLRADGTSEICGYFGLVVLGWGLWRWLLYEKNRVDSMKGKKVIVDVPAF